MRNQDKNPGPLPDGIRREVPHNERDFFESYYRATLRGTCEAEDRHTIGGVGELETRFHYNAVENALLRALAHREPPARGNAVEAMRLVQSQAALRHLDIGSGAGHWIDFFRDVLLVQNSIGTEIVPQLADILRGRYVGEAGIEVLTADVADPDFGPETIGGEVDYLSAIGVMFHIVDDLRFAQAMGNLARCLKPGGLFFVGGDFGPDTRNVQFHHTDRFASWREHQRAGLPPDEIRVNKKVRSLATWITRASLLGLEVVDLVRADRDWAISTPENDVLLLRRPE